MEYRWISAPTPVMNSTIVSDSGSASRSTPTESRPTSIHGKRWNTTWRWCSSRDRSSANAAMPTPNEPNSSSVASTPGSGSRSLRAPARLSTTPASGSAGINQTRESAVISASQQGDVVGGGAGSASHDGDDDPEADHDLGRGDHEHEEHDDLTADVVEGPRER